MDVAGRREDLRYIVRNLELGYPAPFNAVAEETFRAFVRELNSALPTLTTSQVLVRLSCAGRVCG